MKIILNFDNKDEMFVTFGEGKHFFNLDLLQFRKGRRVEWN